MHAPLPPPRKRLWRTMLCGLCLVLGAMPAWSQANLRLNVAPGGFPPYTVIALGQEASGIVVDVLRAVALKAGYSLQPMEIPRNRVERMVLNDELDASPRAMEWTDNPERFIFTDPLLNVRDVIFFSIATPLVYTEPKDLQNKRVGVRLGYSFPVLEPLFANGQIHRENAGSERAALAMLDIKRIDAAVLNEMTALWIIKNEAWNGKFVYSRHEVQSYPYRLMFSQKWRSFVEMFNRELSAMKKDGRMARIIEKYLPDRAVPQK